VVASPVVSPVAADATPVPAASPPVTSPAAAGNADESANTSITELLLKTVAENTGYPPEALNLQMSLEAELGIDSIKRVQILSAVQESIPNLPDLNTAQLASLETLGEIVDFLVEQVGSKKKIAAAVTV
jgi:acyl carrier protein